VLFHLLFVVTHDAAPGACYGLHGAVLKVSATSFL
jgi:hypothetical protein